MHGENDALANVIIFGVIALAAFLPAGFRLVLLPAVVLEILFGVVIGPQVLNLVAPTEILGILSELGLAMLFLIAGLEIDPDEVRGQPMRLAVRGWGLSVSIALVLAYAGWALGLLPAPGFIALALATTAIGALMPILQDQGLLRPPYGPLVLANGAVGEALPLIALSLVLAGLAGVGTQSLVLVMFGVTAAIALGFAGRLKRSALPPVIRNTMDSAAQFPVRLAIFLTVGFASLGAALGVDLVLGAFVAGSVMRVLLPHDLHKQLMDRVSAVGYGFLVPIYFVNAGLTMDIAALGAVPEAIIAIPVFVLMMLVVRGVPVMILYRDLLSLRQRSALALHSGTQLPLVVAISGLAVASGAMPGWCAAALVIAAVITVILFPALAARILAGDPDLRATPETRGQDDV